MHQRTLTAINTLLLLSGLTTRAAAAPQLTLGAGGGPAAANGPPATQPKLPDPFGVAIAPAANVLYFIEFGGHALRKIDAAGVVSTIAGTGTKGFSGDGG